jgi:hypothetical protein
MIWLFKVSIPGNVIALVLSEAIMVFCCYALAAYWVLDESPDVFLIDEGGWWHIAAIVGVILLGLYFQDLYDNYRIRSRIMLVQQMCMVLGIAFLLQALANYGHVSALLLPKWMMVYVSIMVLIVLPLWRLLFMQVVLNTVGARQLLFLGSSPVIQQIIGHLADRTELGLDAMGYLGEDAAADAEVDLMGAPKSRSAARSSTVCRTGPGGLGGLALRCRKCRPSSPIPAAALAYGALSPWRGSMRTHAILFENPYRTYRPEIAIRECLARTASGAALELF